MEPPFLLIGLAAYLWLLGVAWLASRNGYASTVYPSEAVQRALNADVEAYDVVNDGSTTYYVPRRT